jgi:hypothetical protein
MAIPVSDRRRAGGARIGIVLLMGAALVVCDDSARAWGPEGHKIVCKIAYDSLTTAQRREVRRLIGQFHVGNTGPYSSFSTACVFADTARTNSRKFAETHARSLKVWARFGEVEDWHFLNLARTAKRAEAGDCHDDCVLKGIETHGARLADRQLEDADRAEALVFLGHWVGDVHQPLHVSFQDDLGGSKIDRIKGGFYSSKDFHQVWDSGIISTARGSRDWWVYAQTLEDIDPSDRAAWQESTPLEWADESYQITIDDDTDYCAKANGSCNSEGKTRTLKAAYQTKFQPVVELRLQKAGVRLAKLIAAGL